jgi:hypothetical protein
MEHIFDGESKLPGLPFRYILKLLFAGFSFKNDKAV